MLKNNLEKVAKEINDKTLELKLNPGKLKFVTSTAIAYLNTSIDFKKIYALFTPPELITLKDKNEIEYHEEVIERLLDVKWGSSY